MSPAEKTPAEAGHVVVVDDDVAAGIELETELLDGAGMLGVNEAEGEKAEVAIEGEF